MKNTAWNALAECQKTIAELVAKGVDFHAAKREIGRMLLAQPTTARRLLSLRSLDRFLTALPAATMRGKALVYQVGREIDRRAKIMQRRGLRTAM